MMTFDEVKNFLKQRFPLIMVDRVLEFESSVKIKAIKSITGNEICFLGHFPDFAIMPGVYIIEALAQSASVLFSKSTGKGIDSGELMVLGAVNDMRFLAPVFPGYTLVMEVKIIKIVEDAAIVEAFASVDGNTVAKGKLTFARKKL